MHHVHVFETGDPQIVRQLLFRDYLRAHPDVAAEYAQLKYRLAKEHNEQDVFYGITLPTNNLSSTMCLRKLDSMKYTWQVFS